MRAEASITARPGALHWSEQPPLTVRRTGSDRCHLVASAGGPLGGDELALSLQVQERPLTFATTAATVVQPGPGPARFRVRAELRDACLNWHAGHTVICADADYRADFAIALTGASRLCLRESLSLGRHGEPGGVARTRIRITVDGAPLLDQQTVLDGADPALCGPAGTAGMRFLSTAVLVGHGDLAIPPATERFAALPLEGPGMQILALGETGRAAEQAIDNALTCVFTKTDPP